MAQALLAKVARMDSKMEIRRILAAIDLSLVVQLGVLTW